MKFSEVLSIPYVLEVESIKGEDGESRCLAAYSELPNCSAIDKSTLVAINMLEEKRLSMIINMIERGEKIPVPRVPFKDKYFCLASEPVEIILKRLNLEKWLDDPNREVAVHYLEGHNG